MFNVLSALILAVLPLVYAQDLSVPDVSKALQDAKVIPDVVANFTPRWPLEVAFTDSTGNMFLVSAGANLTTNQTAHLPTFAILSNNTAIIGKPYLMAIVDPDAPTPQNASAGQIRHFLGADYISNASVSGAFVLMNQSKTATLTDYIPPAPPLTSAPHRYVVLCYLQNSVGVTPPPGFNASDRRNFNITEFVNSVPGNNFTLLGATYFFVSANDTTGSLKPYMLPNGTGASPAGPSSSPKSADATKFGAAVAWSVLAGLTATGALFL